MKELIKTPEKEQNEMEISNKEMERFLRELTNQTSSADSSPVPTVYWARSSTQRHLDLPTRDRTSTSTLCSKVR